MIRGVAATALLFAAWGPPDALPDAADVVAAEGTLRRWVDAFDLPPPDSPEARAVLRDTHGVCVILRRHGRVLGTGTAAGPGDLTLRRAAGRAMAEALSDPAVGSLPAEFLVDIGPLLTVEMEVAGAPVPLLGTTDREIAEQVSPGLDGVAIRRGGDWAMLFPSQMLATNTAGRAERMIGGLAPQVGLAPGAVEQLRRVADVAFYRFRTIQLVQTAPGRAPFQTFRGSTIVHESEVTWDAVRALASGLADYLIRLESPLEEPVGILGSYRPVADVHEPVFAPPLEQALVAFALARYARAPGIDPSRGELAATAARRILQELMRVVPGEDDPIRSVTTAAAIVVAGRESPALDADSAHFQDLARQRVLEACRPDPALGEAREDPLLQPADPNSRALVALALAGMSRPSASEPGADPAFVRRALDEVWESVPDHMHVALLPWIAWAEALHAEATGTTMERVEPMRRLIQVLDACRQRGPPDLSGGLALSESHRITTTAQTVRPGAFLAWALRDPLLTPPADAPAALGRHLRTVRFVLQLSVRESCEWAFRSPQKARGGLRAATWDSDQPVAAQAMGLLMAAETLSSLDALARGGG